MSHYNIRNKEGYLTSVVSSNIARRFQRTYMGEWKTINGVYAYEFKERVMFGDGEIAIAIFPGSYLQMNA